MVRDTVGVICIILMYLALFYADYVVVRWVILHSLRESLWAPFHAVLFNTLVLLLSISHLKAAFSDPGVVPLPQNRMDLSDIYVEGSDSNGENDKKNWTVCRICETYIPPEASHCLVCNRCIRGMDHHCPWINNCIGEKNHKYFLQFLIYVGILAVYAIILVIISWVFECPHCNDDNRIKMSRFLHSIILFLESSVFGMFVVVVLVDQFEQILHYQNNTEQPKRNSPKLYLLLAHIYGFDHPILRLVSCRNRAKYRKELLIERDV